MSKNIEQELSKLEEKWLKDARKLAKITGASENMVSLAVAQQKEKYISAVYSKKITTNCPGCGHEIYYYTKDKNAICDYCNKKLNS